VDPAWVNSMFFTRAIFWVGPAVNYYVSKKISKVGMHIFFLTFSSNSFLLGFAISFSLWNLDIETLFAPFLLGGVDQEV
jgi:hypothetical protein